MTWQHWVLFIVLAINIPAAWWMIGKPRKPIAVEDFLGTTLVQLILVMLLFWGQR